MSALKTVIDEKGKSFLPNDFALLFLKFSLSIPLNITANHIYYINKNGAKKL